MDRDKMLIYVWCGLPGENLQRRRVDGAPDIDVYRGRVAGRSGGARHAGHLAVGAAVRTGRQRRHVDVDVDGDGEPSGVAAGAERVCCQRRGRCLMRSLPPARRVRFTPCVCERRK